MQDLQVCRHDRTPNDHSRAFADSRKRFIGSGDAILQRQHDYCKQTLYKKAIIFSAENRCGALTMEGVIYSDFINIMKMQLCLLMVLLVVQ